MALMEGEHVGPFNLGNTCEFTMLELAEVVGLSPINRSGARLKRKRQLDWSSSRNLKVTHHQENLTPEQVNNDTEGISHVAHEEGNDQLIEQGGMALVVLEAATQVREDPGKEQSQEVS
ncbi:unnamed protein product [Rhodiola kirilowii]